jgi:putative inorganic carbon (hco3(-)) transporter
MRDLVVLSIVLAGTLAALRRPWIGALMWTWISVMNPHKVAWGFAQDMPFAMMIALATLLGFLFTQDKRNPFIDPSVTCLVIFVGWICACWPFSYYPVESQEMLVKVLKIDLMLIITIALIRTRKQIEWFLGIVAFSIAFYGVKGGIFTLSTGGGQRVWGPGGFIGGNNEIALAIILVIPLIFYFYLTIAPGRVWIKRGLLAVTGLCAIAALGSQSRGALVAITGMSVFLWLRSERKVSSGVVLLVFAVLLLAFLPAEWHDRMNTISSYEEDRSAMGRINAWYMAFNLAADRWPVGGGFAIYEPALFAQYAPVANDIHAAHSIYFQILGEHGWFGLTIWLSMWWFVWRGSNWLRANGREVDKTLWCRHLGSMCQVSLVGYALGGAFLSLAYFDLPYNILVLVVVTKHWMLHTNKEPSISTVTQPDRRLLV